MSIARRTKRTLGLTALSWLLMLAAPAARAEAPRKLSLSDAIAVAKARRADVRQADIDVKAAGVDVLRAALQRVRLTVDVSYTEALHQMNVGAPPEACAAIPQECNAGAHQQLATGTAALNIPIWSGMALEAGWTRANLLQDAAEAHRRAAWRSVGLEAANAYWAVRRAELLLETDRKALERTAVVVAVTKARSDAGIAPVVDFIRAQSSMLMEQANIDDLQGQTDDARAQLASALEITEPLVLTEEPLDAPVTLMPLNQVLDDALRRRPELHAASATLEAQEEQVRVTRGAFWPQLSLFGNADARNELLGIPQKSLIGTFAAGVKVDWQIFDSLTTYTALRHDQLAAARLAEDRTRAIYQVRSEVTSAFGRLKAALARRQPLAEALRASQSGLDLIRRRYEAGTALVIEVLQAQTELQQVELALVNNAIDISVMRTTLDAARGAI